MSEAAAVFSFNLSFRGQSVLLTDVSASTTGEEFQALALHALKLSSDEVELKLLLKGKRIPCDDSTTVASFLTSSKQTIKAPPKVIVMASAKTSVQELNANKQDPTIRGFDQERKARPDNIRINDNSYWGNDLSQPDKNYKFGRLRECPFHDFGHRPTDQTPHAFAARQLLQRLATDPGVIAILQERQLVVGTLGEMDPVDDRLMQKMQQQKQGSCLLGYNTNRGLRIDVKLRTDNLDGFRPYFELVATLIHELSHNWVGEHNALFWANYGQMRIEYFMAHKRLLHIRHQGQSSAALAQIPPAIFQTMQPKDTNNNGNGNATGSNGIVDFVMAELQKDMAQHGLHPQLIAEPIRQRYHELESSLGIRLGGGSGSSTGNNHTALGGGGDKRNLALEAAERRAREEKKHEKDDSK